MENQSVISPYKIREIILDQSKRAHVGHIGSALSVTDILSVLYGSILKISDPDDPLRDRFILSKGHAALALYATFYLKGWLTKEQLDTYCANDSHLGVHPEHHLRGVDFSTGSLGQGLSIGVGSALAARLKKTSQRTFVLVSDAECNEGSVWEAAMVAAHQKLSNLIVIIDLNGQQALGYTKDVIDLNPMSKRWQSFGWDVHDVDGHSISQMTEVLSGLNTNSETPHVIVAHTTFGKGVSYMQNKIKWHYWPMSEEEYRTAKEDIAKLQITNSK